MMCRRALSSMIFYTTSQYKIDKTNALPFFYTLFLDGIWVFWGGGRGVVGGQVLELHRAGFLTQIHCSCSNTSPETPYIIWNTISMLNLLTNLYPAVKQILRMTAHCSITVFFFTSHPSSRNMRKWRKPLWELTQKRGKSTAWLSYRPNWSLILCLSE